MKFKIQAGAELDLLTKGELGEALADWAAEIARGVKFRQISAQSTVTGGVWSIGGSNPDNRSDTLGPAPGMIWAITRLAIAGTGIVPGTDLYAVYINDAAPSKLVESGLTRGTKYSPPTLVLNGGDRLLLTGVGTGTAGDPVVVSGQAIELPVHLGWQLL